MLLYLRLLSTCSIYTFSGSAFPNLASLRYKDENEEHLHHVLCHEGTFVEPENSWNKDGRIYYAVNNLVRKLVVFSGFVCMFVCFVLFCLFVCFCFVCLFVFVLFGVFFGDGGGQNIALYIHI